MLTESERRVMSTCDALFEETLCLTESLVKAYSTLGNEQGALEVMEAWYLKEGFEVERVPMEASILEQVSAESPRNGSRYNVMGKLNAGLSGPHLVLNGHLDVVPAEPESLWTRPPWEPWRDGGWLYGRGAGDMKAGIAAMVMAVKAVRQAGIEISHPLTLQTVIEEECSGHGALSCVKAGHAGDFVLIPEPFGASIVSGQVGVLWFRVSLDGVPTHVLDTRAGSNAIEAITTLFSALKGLEEEMNSLPRPALFQDIKAPFNLNIGRLSGGDWASSVPARATLEGRLGFPPDMAVNDVMSRLTECIHNAAQDLGEGISNLQVDFHGFRSEGVVVDLDNPGLVLLGKCHHDLTGEAVKTQPLTCTTDLSAFHVHGGVPGTCYGPVAEHIHGIDERVNIESIRHVLKAYALFLCRWGQQSQREGKS
ncbi:ArgE/DapE family deacylase [Halomonas kalidii]|uniref:ArgE/DapE family deacylase n=1 Tax=Halomonas kalidii TaxID=3043293 RepID=A0ABT6VTY5_9GAMM|nr:ArgE/DapE family deacylase [Halomonas kalidii]MDI5936423.1 ArgE/DapE family deacylase [Halomonas kalidii]